MFVCRYTCPIHTMSELYQTKINMRGNKSNKN